MTTFKKDDFKRPTCASCFKEIKGSAYKIHGKPQWQCQDCYIDDEPIEE